LTRNRIALIVTFENDISDISPEVSRVLDGRLPFRTVSVALLYIKLAMPLACRGLAIPEILAAYPVCAVGAALLETKLLAYKLAVGPLAIYGSVFFGNELDITVPRVGTVTVTMTVVSYVLAIMTVHFINS
jgi:hypothetical protein